MKKPKMILFDYGQTLVQEQKFNSKAGYEAVLQYAVKNTHNHTAEEVQAASDAINDELGRRDPARRKALQFEIPNDMFTTYLFESLGITLSLNPKEIDSIFWNAAAPGTNIFLFRMPKVQIFSESALPLSPGKP